MGISPESDFCNCGAHTTNRLIEKLKTDVRLELAYASDRRQANDKLDRTSFTIGYEDALRWVIARLEKDKR
jgi:hypothetical protein